MPVLRGMSRQSDTYRSCTQYLPAVFQFIRLALCFHCQDHTPNSLPMAPTEDPILHPRQYLLRYHCIMSEDLMAPKFVCDLSIERTTTHDFMHQQTVLESQLRGSQHLTPHVFSSSLSCSRFANHHLISRIFLYTNDAVQSGPDSTFNRNQVEDGDSDVNIVGHISHLLLTFN